MKHLLPVALLTLSTSVGFVRPNAQRPSALSVERVVSGNEPVKLTPVDRAWNTGSNARTSSAVLSDAVHVSAAKSQSVRTIALIALIAGSTFVLIAVSAAIAWAVMFHD